MKNNIMMEKHDVHVKSDNYFNHPEYIAEMEDYCNPEPVDAFGAFVPQGKSLSNLKKMEESIRERFNLGE